MVPCAPNRRPGRPSVVGLGAGRGPCPPTPKIRGTLERVSASAVELCPSPATKRLMRTVTGGCELGSRRIFIKMNSSSILTVDFLAFFGSRGPILFPSVACSFCSM